MDTPKSGFQMYVSKLSKGNIPQLISIIIEISCDIFSFNPIILLDHSVALVGIYRGASWNRMFA